MHFFEQAGMAVWGSFYIGPIPESSFHNSTCQLLVAGFSENVSQFDDPEGLLPPFFLFLFLFSDDVFPTNWFKYTLPFKNETMPASVITKAKFFNPLSINTISKILSVFPVSSTNPLLVDLYPTEPVFLMASVRACIAYRSYEAFWHPSNSFLFFMLFIFLFFRCYGLHSSYSTWSN